MDEKVISPKVGRQKKKIMFFVALICREKKADSKKIFKIKRKENEIPYASEN